MRVIKEGRNPEQEGKRSDCIACNRGTTASTKYMICAPMEVNDKRDMGRSVMMPWKEKGIAVIRTKKANK